MVLNKVLGAVAQSAKADSQLRPLAQMNLSIECLGKIEVIFEKALGYVSGV
jgi:hypothetical protein